MFLVENGASPAATDLRDRTPLDYARGLPVGRGQAPVGDVVNKETVALLERLTADRRRDQQ